MLADFADSPAIALVRDDNSVYLLVGFDMMESNWPFVPSFVMFCYNAAAYLGMEVEQSQDAPLSVGQPLTLAGQTPGTKGKVSGPGIEAQPIVADPSGAFRFAATDRVGVYQITPEGKPPTTFAVNLLDDHESFIQPRPQVTLLGQTATAQADGGRLGNLELWPFLALLALVLVCAEWLLYNSRAKL